jgi:hypothetical protein
MSDGVRRHHAGNAQSYGEMIRAKTKPDLRRKAYTPKPGFISAPCRAGKCNDCYSLKCSCNRCHFRA